MLKLATTLILVIFMSGCSISIKFLENNNTTQNLIIGIGVVSLPTKPTNGVSAYKINTLGVNLSNNSLSIGYLKKSTVAIPLGANVITEISDKPLGDINITTNYINKE